MLVDKVTEWSTPGEDGHTEATRTGVTNPADVTRSPEDDAAEVGVRCAHGLTACRPCYTAPPGVNRFYPAPRAVRAQMHEQGRWMLVVPNRRDRRSQSREKS